MDLVVVAFLAGVLTAAAPCVLPLLPVIVGGSILTDSGTSERRSLRHPLIIVASLAVSIIIFSLLLKATTALLGVPSAVWSYISGGIVIVLGVMLIWPSLWDRLAMGSGLENSTGKLMASSQEQSGVKKDILLGAALGPAFNSCSPTYALIVAVILPASFGRGFAYLVAYAAGLSSILLIISIGGRAVVDRLNWLSDPRGRFRKVIGVIFVLVGLMLILGLDRDIQAWILENGWYDPIKNLEGSIN
jgi:cytochrome c-type biogenesis protein